MPSEVTSPATRGIIPKVSWAIVLKASFLCASVCDATLAFIKRCNVLSAIIVMADFREQRACIKFCFKLGKTDTVCCEMLKTALGEPKLNPVNGKVRGHLDRRRQGK